MKNENPLVSIVIPVYNGSNYLREAIDSALAQIYKNIEIIVVNDGSNDNGATESIARSYGDRIRYFSKPNGGTSTALNLGIKNMKGEYFSWLSHDDMYYPNKIQLQINELSKLQDKYTIIMTDLDGINENYEKIYQTDYALHIKAYPPRTESKIHPIIYNQTHGCTLLIPRKCFDEVGLFDESELVAQDFEFFYRAFSKFPHKLISKILVTARDSSNRQGRRSKARGDVEYSRLFIKIIEGITDEEMKLLAPSRMEFYADMRNFFAAAEYSIALKFIEDKFYTNLQISSFDLTGQRFNGHDLHFFLRESGIDSKQLVLNKQSNDENTYTFNFFEHCSKELIHQKLLLESDIIHMHLVHNIFDINYLPILTKLKPTIITLHDPFFLGGHCVHHFECEKWKSHCEDCMHLDKDFVLYKDISALNYAIKKEAIQNSQISAIVASEWMRKKVSESPIWKDKKIYLLPFGINQNLFTPGDCAAARESLNIPEDNTVLLFRSDCHVYKGFDIIIDALKKIDNNGHISLIAVGAKGFLGEVSGKYHTIEFDWINDEVLMAKLYHACDIFLMPSRQETFGFMAVEAMSCGKMVLAIKGDGTALPEVINSPECGLAVDESEFSSELNRLINNKFEVKHRGNGCADYARVVYSKDKYVKTMMSIYDDVIRSHQKSEESEFLLSQLIKHADNLFIGHATTESNIVIAATKNKFLKKTVRLCAKVAWKAVSVLGLKRLIQSSSYYNKLRRNGTIDKLRGQ